MTTRITRDQINPHQYTCDDVSIRILGLEKVGELLYPHGHIEYDGGVHYFDCKPKGEIQPSDKIIVVTYHTGQRQWIPFSVEALTIIINQHDLIEDMMIVGGAK